MDICMPLCKHFAVSHQVFMSIMDRFNCECFAVINEYWISALAKSLYNVCVSEKQVRRVHTHNGKSRWRFQTKMHLQLRCPRVSSARFGSASIWDHIPILTWNNLRCGWACHFHSAVGAGAHSAVGVEGNVLTSPWLCNIGPAPRLELRDTGKVSWMLCCHESGSSAAERFAW